MAKSYRIFFALIFSSMTLLLGNHAGAADTKTTAIVKITDIHGTEFHSIPKNSQQIYFLRYYIKETGQELGCDADFDLDQIEIINQEGTVISSVRPFCNTNLGGIASMGLSVSTSGVYSLKTVSPTKDFDFSLGELTVNEFPATSF